MLARADFDQRSRASLAVSHARLLGPVGRIPYGPLHKVLLGLTWLETWLRLPLKTLKMLDGVDETFSLLDPDGQRFGLTKEVRARFRKNLLYFQICDLVTLLACLERPGFRRRAFVVENKDVLLRERERGPGTIVAGFRIGAYPVVPWALASLGFPVSMIVGGSHLVEMGRGLGGTFLPSSTERIRFVSARDPRVLASCLENLNAGGLACTLVEMSPVEFAKTTEVQFLEWTIQVPYGIAYLAAATGRSIVPAVLTREAGPRFRLRFGEPLPAPARDRASIYESTQQLYHALEEQVLRFPEQWIGWPLLASHMGIKLHSGTSAGAPPIS
jgi:lauroyl/myristoyl acyltransferase